MAGYLKIFGTGRGTMDMNYRKYKAVNDLLN